MSARLDQHRRVLLLGHQQAALTPGRKKYQRITAEITRFVIAPIPSAEPGPWVTTAIRSTTIRMPQDHDGQQPRPAREGEQASGDDDREHSSDHRGPTAHAGGIRRRCQAEAGDPQRLRSARGGVESGAHGCMEIRA